MKDQELVSVILVDPFHRSIFCDSVILCFSKYSAVVETVFEYLNINILAYVREQENSFQRVIVLLMLTV